MKSDVFGDFAICKVKETKFDMQESKIVVYSEVDDLQSCSKY